MTDFYHKQSYHVLQKIISVDNEELEDEVKQKLSISIGDAQCLLEKKKKEEVKREKIKKMEEDFQEKMLTKRKAMSEKSTKSEQFREKQKQQQDKRMKFKSVCYQKIVNKIQHNHQKQIRSALKLQREYFNKINYASPKLSKIISLTSSKKSQSMKEHQRRLSIQEKMAKILDKTNKAQKLHEYLNQAMVQKMKVRAKIVEEAQQRLFHTSLIQQAQKLRSIYQKNHSIQKMNYRSKCQTEKKNIEKTKSVQQKINKCNKNLKELLQIRIQKNRQLQKKFKRKSEPKQWKDDRFQRNKQKCLQNIKKIDFEKELKAEQILHKHQQISLENRIYKEQKDKLIQAIKFSV